MDLMEEDDSSRAETKPQPFTPAERIAELNEIDKSVASLLKSAGAAIQVLANSPQSSTSTTTASTLSAQQDAFAQHTSTYFATLSSIEVRLRRQVYALEEAGLIAPGEGRDAKSGQTLGTDERGAIAGGPLDVSWLNARASDAVGKNMEKELWARAKGLVEQQQRLRKKAPAGEDGQVDEASTGEEVRDEDNMANA